jgi:hypothetical protein
MPIDVMPEKSGWYTVRDDKEWSCMLHFELVIKEWYIRDKHPDFMNMITHWHKPINLTLQELLQTDEGKEIIREVFRMSRQVMDDDTWSFKYQAADDFINNTK